MCTFAVVISAFTVVAHPLLLYVDIYVCFILFFTIF